MNEEITILWYYHPSAFIVFLTVAGFLVTISVWAGKVESSRVSTSTFMTEIRDKLDRIFLLIPGPTTEFSSPIALTDLGREISADLDAKDWARKKAPLLRPRAETMNAYEIQEMCFDQVRKNVFGKSLFGKIQVAAYERGIAIEHVQRVFAIELRDELLKHTGKFPRP